MFMWSNWGRVHSPLLIRILARPSPRKNPNSLSNHLSCERDWTWERKQNREVEVAGCHGEASRSSQKKKKTQQMASCLVHHFSWRRLFGQRWGSQTVVWEPLGGRRTFRRRFGENKNATWQWSCRLVQTGLGCRQMTKYKVYKSWIPDTMNSALNFMSTCSAVILYSWVRWRTSLFTLSLRENALPKSLRTTDPEWWWSTRQKEL